jgi:Zn-dependent protease
MIISINEILDIVIISIALGYIFGDMFEKYRRSALHANEESEEYDPLLNIQKRGIGGINWKSIEFAMMVTAPAIILHEFGHKFVAMAFGATATFHAASFFGIPYGGVLLGVVLKLMNTGFIFFIPAYVSHTAVSNIGNIMIAFAGPAVNLILWIVPMIIMKPAIAKTIRISRKWVPIMLLTSKINMLLFIFNMLPIPGFDGYWVFSGIWDFLKVLI